MLGSKSDLCVGFLFFLFCFSSFVPLLMAMTFNSSAVGHATSAADWRSTRLYSVIRLHYRVQPGCFTFLESQ